jgi:hypothetical protein
VDPVVVEVVPERGRVTVSQVEGGGAFGGIGEPDELVEA